MSSGEKPCASISPAMAGPTPGATESFRIRTLIAISQTLAALTRICDSGSAISRFAAIERRLLPSIHQRNACVSRRARTLLAPGAELFLGQRLEKSPRHAQLALHGAETAARDRRVHRDEADHRRLVARDDLFL